MKKILLLFFLIPLILCGQDNFTYDNTIVFGEKLTDEYTSRRNGGLPTDVTFSSGSAAFDGSSTQYIEYLTPSVIASSNFSIRIIGTYNNDAGGNIMGFGNSAEHYLRIKNDSKKVKFEVRGTFGNTANFASNVNVFDSTAHEIIFVKSGVNGAWYVDGSASGTIGTLDANYSLSNRVMLVGNLTKAGTYVLDGTISLVEIYNYALTAFEVLNLYNKVRYTSLNKNWIFDVDTRLGTIQDNIGNAISNTSTDVTKHNNWSTADFNGVDSKLDIGDLDDLTGDVSIVAWIYPKSVGQGNLGKIVDNGKLLFGTGGEVTPRLRFISDGSTGVNSYNNSISLNTWQLVTATRNATGDETNFYVDGTLASTGNQNSGTPAAGTTNIIVGNNNGITREFDGYLDRVRVVNSILTMAEISQIYTSEGFYYE